MPFVLGYVDYSDRFDCEDVPPAGTGCFVCRLNDHFCPANGYLCEGQLAVCAACVMGAQCSQRIAVQKRAGDAWWAEHAGLEKVS